MTNISACSVLLVLTIACNHHTKYPSNAAYIIKEDSLYISLALEELSPIIEKHGINYHYDNGSFAISIPMLGNYYKLDKFGNISAKSENYSKDEAINSVMLFKGVYMGNIVANGIFYSYWFSNGHAIKSFNPQEGSTKILPLNVRGSILHCDFFTSQNDLYFSRYGRIGGDLVFEIYRSKDDKKDNSGPIISKSILKDGIGFPPCVVSSEDKKIFILCQDSDSLEVYSDLGKFEEYISLTRSKLRSYEKKEMPKGGFAVTYSEIQKHKSDKYLGLFVDHDTVYTFHTMIVVDSMNRNESRKILTIQSGSYFRERVLDSTFVGMGTQGNYFSLERKEDNVLLHSKALHRLGAEAN